MLQLDLKVPESYPQRYGVPDCVFYMRTGVCGYGDRCRYNHPCHRAAVEAAVRATGDYPDRPGEPLCQFYLKTGTCRFGASCKFHHPKHSGRSMSHVPLNTYGYPLRPDENDCSYYLKTGQCRFGITCKFHHPQPTGTSLPASAPQFYPPVQSPSVAIAEQYGGASPSLRVVRPPLLATSYVQGAYGPVLFSPRVVPFSGWSPYLAPVSSVLSRGAQPAVGATSQYGVQHLSSSMPAHTGPYPSLPSLGPSSSGQKEQSFPERSGEPECQYFLKTGDCKFGLSCRYHHPRNRVVPTAKNKLCPQPTWSPSASGDTAWYFLHAKWELQRSMGTIRNSPPASSLIETPVAPYPVGSLPSTLAPASSSDDLGPELMSGSKKDSLLSRIPSSGSTSSSLVGLIFSDWVCSLF